MQNRPSKTVRLLLRYRRIPVIAIHAILVVLSNYGAFWLRFDGAIPERELALMLDMLPWLIAIRGITFMPFRLYMGLWRYTGIWDLRNIIGGVALSSVIFYSVAYWVLGQTEYSRGVIIVDSILLLCLMGGVRLLRRIWQGLGSGLKSKRKILIYGAGDAGERVVRGLKYNISEQPFEPVGFVDDSAEKSGRRIHGVEVLGTSRDFARLLSDRAPDEIWLAIPSAEPATFRKIVNELRSFRIPIKTLPSLKARHNGQFEVDQVRDLKLEDLLERAPVGLDSKQVRQLLTGKRILVTGAGGSIGSELCRQICQFHPEMILLLDKSEQAIYSIDMEIGEAFPEVIRVALLADIKHTPRIEEIFAEFQPQIILHAAAYKHVPMMESHPTEAVLNNVIGSKRLCEMAVKHGVDSFVVISTDKAVNPTNVMGASKRLVEMYVQALAHNGNHGKTSFSSVRFGNVLGSSGSVVPLFRNQVAAGGPVTVTHPEIARYFMTIPEAVQLVLQAAALSLGGEIFVLEMGEQLKLVDVARNVIRLSGLVPEKDIPIKFIGLRPGEKLREELVGMDEAVDSSSAEKILVVHSGWIPDLGMLNPQIAKLERLAFEGRGSDVLSLLFELVPTFRPMNPNIRLQLENRSYGASNLKTFRPKIA